MQKKGLSTKDLINRFWAESEKNSFSKDAVILFLYLIQIVEKSNSLKVYLHPLQLGILVKNFTTKSVEEASQELVKRQILKYTPSSSNCTSHEYDIILP